MENTKADGHFAGDAYILTGETEEAFGATWNKVKMIEGANKGKVLLRPRKSA